MTSYRSKSRKKSFWLLNTDPTWTGGVTENRKRHVGGHTDELFPSRTWRLKNSRSTFRLCKQLDKRALNKALKEERKEVMALSFPAVTSNTSGLFLWRQTCRGKKTDFQVHVLKHCFHPRSSGCFPLHHLCVVHYATLRNDEFNKRSPAECFTFRSEWGQPPSQKLIHSVFVMIRANQRNIRVCCAAARKAEGCPHEQNKHPLLSCTALQALKAWKDKQLEVRRKAAHLEFRPTQRRFKF